MTAIIIIALLLGGGVSVAAEGALPGSVLYPVKVGINEEVRSAFAVGENQVRWDMRRVERRISEARELAERGRLDAEVRAKIEARLSAHAEEFEKNMEALSEKGNETSFELRSDFSELLRNQERELSLTATEHADARTELYILLRVINSDLEEVERKVSESREGILEHAGAGIQVSAEGKLGAAEHALDSLRMFVDARASSTSEVNLAGAKAGIKIIEDIIVRGKADMSSGNFAQAFLTFHEAIRATADLRRSFELSMHEREDEDDIDSEETSMELDIDADMDTVFEHKDGDREDGSDRRSASTGASVNVDASVQLR